MTMKMVRATAESNKHTHEGHKELPRFGPPWWCNTLLLHVWDCSAGDDHGEIYKLGGSGMVDPFYGALAST